MKLLRVHIIKAATCGGLLDGFELQFRPGNAAPTSFEPLCLIGPNGAGKSQLIQAISEIFQSAIHAIAPDEERKELNPDIEFELEYSILPKGHSKPSLIRLERKREGRKKPELVLCRHTAKGWKSCKSSDKGIANLLPERIIGYTSGGNETLSLPFLSSRSGYAKDVAERALGKDSTDKRSASNSIPEPRLTLIDYSTHIEVLVANVMLGSSQLVTDLLKHAHLDDLRSFRIVIQLAHSAAPKAPKSPNQSIGKQPHIKRKGIQLTTELERTIESLKNAATCWDYEDSVERYTFDYFVDTSSKQAFRSFWKKTLDLYSSLRKLSMLNDLAISKKVRDRFERESELRRFASRLPEPQDEDKVFRFEHVTLHSSKMATPVNYVSLSDGEHQLAQILGTFAMVSFPGVLFLLDEPESHSNPKWRVEFISSLMDLRTPNGDRRTNTPASRQDALITTHAPFVPSDIDRERVLIFRKDVETKEILVKRPLIQTFGTSFEAILEECFGVTPPISGEARNEIDRLRRSKSEKNVIKGMEKLGYSLEKAILADHLRNLKNTKK